MSGAPTPDPYEEDEELPYGPVGNRSPGGRASPTRAGPLAKDDFPELQSQQSKLGNLKQFLSST